MIKIKTEVRKTSSRGAAMSQTMRQIEAVNHIECYKLRSYRWQTNNCLI